MCQPLVITLMKISFLPFGIVNRQEYKKFVLHLTVLFNLSIFISLFGVIIVFGNPDTSLLENIYTLNSAVAVLRSFWLGRLHRNLINNLYQKISDFCAESEEFVAIFDKIIKNTVKYSIVVGLAVFFVISVPIYTITCTKTKPSDVKAFVYPSWYPWTVDNSLVYVLTISFQIINILACYYVLLCICSVFFCLISFKYICFRKLETEILTMQERIQNTIQTGEGRIKFANVQLESEKNYELHLRMYSEFVRIIKNHQSLLR